MKIALFHNYYHHRGGEDVMFELECDALAKAGHTVLPYTVHNTGAVAGASMLSKARTAWRAAYSPPSRQQVLEFLLKEKPDISHVHNWFPLLSPSIYSAHREAGVPVVQTLHNYRMGCAAGNYRRKGAQCHLCRPGNTHSAVINRCYRGSLVGSLAWRRMAERNWRKGTFTEEVSHYIAPSQEMAKHHIQMGIPESMISIIPNACKDPLANGSSPAQLEKGSGHGAVFVGRLVREKGVDILVRAWNQLSLFNKNQAPSIPDLVIVGSGPEEESLRKQANGARNIHFKGQLPRSGVDQAISSARMLVFPSRWAEPFGLGIIEAMASARPVIASNAGAPPEIVSPGVNGMLFARDDSLSLRFAINELLGNPEKAQRMGQAARSSYETRYRPDIHGDNLLQLFDRVLAK